MNRIFTVGGFCFRLSYPEEYILPDNIRLFETPDGKPDYCYTLQLADELPQLKGAVAARREDLIVLRTPAGESRIIGIQNGGGFYACYQETAPDHAEIVFLRAYLRLSRSDTIFNSLLALERRMLERGGLILHCAYLCHGGEAILFSAPSGTGKSTQADLWGKYRGSETINGDRALLQQLGGRFYARSWPVCGSSEICRMQDTPIRAIVMLSQQTENTAVQLPPAEAFRQLYSQITVNRWDQAAVLQTMDLIGALLEQVPVAHLGCDISEEAVRCLEQLLYPDAHTGDRI